MPHCPVSMLELHTRQNPGPLFLQGPSTWGFNHLGRQSSTKAPSSLYFGPLSLGSPTHLTPNNHAISKHPALQYLLTAVSSHDASSKTTLRKYFHPVGP